ncbi:hypothetical protein GYMLUDRAFT_135149, partial [Collybiopsis luxurians FD-317 M1]
IFIWDALSNIAADWNLFRTARNKLSLTVYVISRIGTLAFLLGRVIFGTYPIGNCKIASVAIDSLYPIAVAGSCLLFFFRARAVYYGHRGAIVFFAFLWVAVLGTCLVVPFGLMVNGDLKPTQYCISTSIKPYVGAAVIVPTVHDTVVFLAVSYKLMSNSLTEPRGLQERILGNNLPRFSRAMFRDSQKYYLVTVLANLATISLMYAPVNPAKQITFNSLNVLLTNVMACYVYRHT